MGEEGESWDDWCRDLDLLSGTHECEIPAKSQEEMDTLHKRTDMRAAEHQRLDLDSRRPSSRSEDSVCRVAYA
jgi:hypothetical protein